MNVWKTQTISNIKYDGQLYVSSDSSNDVGGQLVVILNANLTHLGSKIPFEEIVNFISSTYYSGLDEDKKFDPEQELERTILEFKKYILNFFSQTSKEEIAKYFSVFIGVLYDGELIFARNGDIRMFLLYKQSFMEIEDEDTEDSAYVWDDFMSFITRGPVSKNSLLFIGNSIVFDYFSDAKLYKILSYGWEKGIKEYQNLISEFGGQNFFQTVIIGDLEQDRVMAQAPKQSVHTNESVDRLVELHNDTSFLMSESFMDKLKGDISKLVQRIKQSDETEELTGDEAIKRRIEEKSKVRKIAHFLQTNIKKLFIVIVWILSYIPKIFKSVYKNKKSFTYNARHYTSVLLNFLKFIPSYTAKFYKKQIDSYKNFDERRKNIFLGICAVSVLLIASILLGVSQVKNSKNSEEIMAKLEEVEIKRSSAEAALLYGNEKQATSLVSEARRMLASIDVSNVKDEIKQRRSEVASDLFQIYKQIQKLEIIDDVSPVFMGSASLPEGTEIVSVLSSDRLPYFFTDNGDIYVIDSDKKEVNKIGVWKGDGDIKTVSYIGDGVIAVQVVNPTPELNFLNTDKKEIQKIDIKWNNPETPKQSIIPYFRRIYVLDSRDRQIYRHQKFGDGYLKGVAWVKDETIDLSDAVSMAIDGNIWVATQSGNIYKLNAGKREDFDLSAIDPAINTPNYIWTDVNSKYVYISDPATRRVIVLEKDGTLFRQYVSKKFDDIKGIAVSKDGGKIYVLNGLNIYEITVK